MIQVVTFDAAGTIVDHRWDPAGVAVSSAKRLGIELPADARERYARLHSAAREKHVEVERRGDPAEIRRFWQGLLEDWLIDMGSDPALGRAMFELCSSTVLGPESDLWSLYDDVVPTLDSLGNVRAGIISNWDSSLHTVLKNLGIHDRFDFVIASLEFGVEKPDRRIFEEAVRRSGVSPSQLLHVGDSYEDDYLGATDAGLQSLHLDRFSPSDRSANRICTLIEVQEAL